MINTKVHFEHENKDAKIKVLFILKERANYGTMSSSVSYGLINSCKFVSECLKPHGIHFVIVAIVDGHDIDRVVNHYKPTHVFIEAVWCPPEKFPILIKLHPRVKWNVRLHSNLPFLIQEGNIIEILNKYNDIAKKYPNHFSISGNNRKLIGELNTIGYKLGYLPNCYPLGEIKLNTDDIGHTLSIGCFGAFRILKNQTEQAVAAIQLADKLGKKLKFYVNTSIFETHSNGILKNIRNIFKNTHHSLIECEWSHHSDFIKLVKRMDVGMQVSMSETFNIVAADFVSAGIPIVGSKEIEFLSHHYQAEPTDLKDITNKLEFALKYKKFGFHLINEILLRDKIKESIEIWLQYLGN